jgi:quinol monooxygenase YgiN
MILVLGSVIARDGYLPQVLAMSREHVARSRKEPGCIAHGVHQDTENSQRLVFVEQWATEDSLWEHFKVSASRAFAKSMGELSAETPTLSIYQATPVTPPGRPA